MNSLPAWHVAGFLMLHVGAIACAFGTRIAAGTRYELLFQWLFLPALGAVGMATWFCHTAAISGSAYPRERLSLRWRWSR